MRDGRGKSISTSCCFPRALSAGRAQHARDACAHARRWRTQEWVQRKKRGVKERGRTRFGFGKKQTACECTAAAPVCSQGCLRGSKSIETNEKEMVWILARLDSSSRPANADGKTSDGKENV